MMCAMITRGETTDVCWQNGRVFRRPTSSARLTTTCPNTSRSATSTGKTEIPPTTCVGRATTRRVISTAQTAIAFSTTIWSGLFEVFPSWSTIETVCSQDSCAELEPACIHDMSISTFSLLLIHTSKYHKPRIRVSGATGPPAMLNTASRPRKITLWQLATSIATDKIGERTSTTSDVTLCLESAALCSLTTHCPSAVSTCPLVVRRVTACTSKPLVRVQICLWCFAFQHHDPIITGC